MTVLALQRGMQSLLSFQECRQEGHPACKKFDYGLSVAMI